MRRGAGVLLIAMVGSFFLTRLGGSPVRLLLPLQASEDDVAEVTARLGLDQSLPRQLATYLGNVASGDLGFSYYQNQPAWDIISSRIPATLELVGAALLVAIVIGVAFGFIAGVRRRSVWDHGANTFAILGQSVPPFWSGILAIYLLAVTYQIFPPSGRGGLDHLVLPAMTLGIFVSPVLIRMTRSSVVAVLNQDFIELARAKGLSERQVVVRHAVRNAGIPVITVIGILAAQLLAGAVVTEVVFSWPGVGRLMVTSATKFDYPVVQACVVVIAAAVVLINLFVDVCYLLIDPRVRRSGRAEADR